MDKLQTAQLGADRGERKSSVVGPLAFAAVGAIASIGFMYTYGLSFPNEKAGLIRYAFGAIVMGTMAAIAGDIIFAD